MQPRRIELPPERRIMSGGVCDDLPGRLMSIGLGESYLILLS
jgi:hypothetical protein